MKNPEIYLKEFVQRLSEEHLKFLSSRFSQQLGGDLSEVVDFLSNVKEIDRWLVTAESYQELFEMIDVIQNYVQKECERRNALINESETVRLS